MQLKVVGDVKDGGGGGWRWYSSDDVTVDGIRQVT